MAGSLKKVLRVVARPVCGREAERGGHDRIPCIWEFIIFYDTPLNSSVRKRVVAFLSITDFAS